MHAGITYPLETKSKNAEWWKKNDGRRTRLKGRGLGQGLLTGKAGAEVPPMGNSAACDQPGHGHTLHSACQPCCLPWPEGLHARRGWGGLRAAGWPACRGKARAT
jgi:hypothetical protein